MHLECLAQFLLTTRKRADYDKNYLNFPSLKPNYKTSHLKGLDQLL